MYIRVIRQKVQSGGLKALSAAAKQNFPDVSSVPGFLSYYVIDLGPDQYATVGVFKDKAAADKWAEKGRQHVKQHKLDSHLKIGTASLTGFSGKVVYSKTA